MRRLVMVGVLLVVMLRFTPNDTEGFILDGIASPLPEIG